jgi:acyl-CoA synthetase (AMP-forming)/AMP-acid ligase II
MVWLNMGEILRVNAKKYPTKLAVKDAVRMLTYLELDLRTNKLANALNNLGVQQGDKMAILLNNCTEWIEIYCALAKIGAIAVPVNCRYVGKEIVYVVNNSDSRGIIFGENFISQVESIKGELEKVDTENFIAIGKKDNNWFHNYEKLISESDGGSPNIKVDIKSPWILLYTSGTTGVPKGVVRSHESYVAFFLINAVDFGFSNKDYGMIVMPLYHVNSTFYGFVFLYIGASLYIHRETKFDPVELLSIIDREKITFTSLIPTHYNLILNVPEAERKKYDLTSMRKILCSSAPARGEMKKAIMAMFPNVELFEAYGSTEAGLVTLLTPEDQLRKLASIGQECGGTDLIKVLDENGNEVPVGQVGELYSRGPMMFTEYYKLPEKTASSFRGEFFSAGDMVKKDEDGFYYIVDRKDNLIITGGEHVYPSEVEKIICSHPKVMDCAIIGVPHEKWGEAVKAVVVLKEGESATPEEIIDFCRGKMAGYKRPKSVDFIPWEDMPRTPTGKILHRKLRERYSK